MFKTERTAKASPKSEITERKILEAALYLFRTKGFDEATMRDIAAAAEVATGAAYYYYPSKDAIVLAFYQRSCDEMQPQIADAVTKSAGNLEDRLKELIRVKLEYFAPYRGVLRALLKNGADPAHPLSPFSQNNKSIREVDQLPDVLWIFQMGVIYFWITDDSHGQRRTDRLLALGAKIVTSLLKIAGLPLTRPLRRVAVELIETVKGV